MARSVGLVAVAWLVLALGVARGAEVCSTTLDLQPKANQPLSETFMPGDYPNDNLAELPKGEQHFGGVEFLVGPKMIQLAGKFVPGAPKQVEGIAVGRLVNKLELLHGARWGAFGGPANPLGHWVPDGTPIAYYKVTYADGDAEAIPVVYGQDVRDWWSVWDHDKPTTRSQVVWRGTNAHVQSRQDIQGKTPLRLYLSTWENPRPKVPVTSISLVSLEQVPALFCVAITAEGPAQDYRLQNEQLKKELVQTRQGLERLLQEVKKDVQQRAKQDGEIKKELNSLRQEVERLKQLLPKHEAQEQKQPDPDKKEKEVEKAS